MVDTPERHPGAEPPPFALRSTIYTILFLLVILGVVPSIFFLAGGIVGGAKVGATIREFWYGFRSLVGAAVFAIGLATYTYCSVWLIFFGKGPHVEFDPPKAFVATGPYRWVRNPVVITLLVTVLGESIWFGSVGILILLAIGLPLAHYQVTRIEEPRLKQRFGESYEDYCRRVNRWLPRVPQG